MERKDKESKMKDIHAAICIVNQMLEFLPDDYKKDSETTLPISILEDYKNMLNK